MITLHQYPKVWGLSSLSPFCIKVEVFLKLAQLPYEVVVQFNPKNAPKGKMPFIEDGEEKIADSSFIIEYLIQKYQLQQFSIDDPIEKARAHSLKLMIEESLYFSLLHSRWVEEENYQQLKKDFIPLFPYSLGRPALFLIRQSLKKQSMAQGIGRHSQAEINHLSTQMISTLSLSLGDQSYFIQNKISYLDATVYSFLITVLKQPFSSHLKREIEKYRNLCDFVLRIENDLTRSQEK